MGSSKKKKLSAAGSSKKKSGSGGTRKVAVPTDTRQRVGMPAQDSIISETTLRSPKGNVYRILKTDETDEYDEPASPKGGSRKR